MKSTPPPARPRRPGRPRSQAARHAVLAAARRLLREKGYGAVTMEGLARASGVGKPTLYRWWPSKGAIYREAYAIDAADFLGSVDTGGLESDLRAILDGIVRLFANSRNGEALAGMFAEAQLHPETFPDFQSGILGMRAKGLARALRLAQGRGELPADFDAVLAGDLIFGPVLYRLLLRHGPIDPPFARTLVDQFMQHARTRPAWRHLRNPV